MQALFRSLIALVHLHVLSQFGVQRAIAAPPIECKSTCTCKIKETKDLTRVRKSSNRQGTTNADTTSPKTSAS